MAGSHLAVKIHIYIYMCTCPVQSKDLVIHFAYWTIFDIESSTCTDGNELDDKVTSMYYYAGPDYAHQSGSEFAPRLIFAEVGPF